jgi:hypothetical protein
LQGILIPTGSFESSFRTSFGGLGILFVASCELWNEQIAGPLLDAAQIKSMVEEFKQVITASSTRKKERAERTQTEDFDAEEGELLEEENEQEEEVFDQVGECLGSLLKTFKVAFLPYFEELIPYITPMLGKDRTPEERRVAICIFDDVAEQCGDTSIKYRNNYLAILNSNIYIYHPVSVFVIYSILRDG